MSKILLFDTDGTINPSKLSRKHTIHRINFRTIEDIVQKDIRDDKAVTTIYNAIRTNYSDFMLSFFGSGDFHHFTLFMLKYLSVKGKKFYLVMFDHHYDVGSFRLKHGDQMEYNFGSWMYSALHMPACQGVILVGPPEGWLWSKFQHVPYLKKNFNLHVVGEFAENKEKLFKEYLDKVPEDCDVYLTVDKDVLKAEELETDWDPGSLTLNELYSMVQLVIDKFDKRLLGADVCGDPRHVVWYKQNELRDIRRDHLLFNQRFIKLFNNYLGD